jgi:ribose transport system substrate-binding protein
MATTACGSAPFLGAALLASLRLAVLSSTLAALALGCGVEEDDGFAGKSYRIVVIPKGTTHEFWKMIEAGVRKAEKEINGAGKIRVEVIWKGPLKEDDTTDQVELARTFLNRDVAGMVLAPLDRRALVGPVAEWKAAGRPVVILDSGLDGESGKDFVTYVATDNYRGGVLAARRLAEVLEEKGKVILLRYQVGSESTEQRERGFLDTLEKEFPNIRVISKDQYAGATEQEAFEKSQNLLTRFAGEVDGIFCPNESSAAGMLGALTQAGLAGEVRFVGFDAGAKLVKGLREHKVHGLVLQDPVKMSYEGVQALIAHLEGKELPTYIDTGVVVATPENMERPELQALHSPDLSQWLGN